MARPEAFQPGKEKRQLRKVIVAVIGMAFATPAVSEAQSAPPVAWNTVEPPTGAAYAHVRAEINQQLYITQHGSIDWEAKQYIEHYDDSRKDYLMNTKSGRIQNFTDEEVFGMIINGAEDIEMLQCATPEEKHRIAAFYRKVLLEVHRALSANS